MKRKLGLLFAVSLILSIVFCFAGCALTVSSPDSKIQYANRMSETLKKHDNYGVAYNFTAGELEGYIAGYVYSKTEDGDLIADYVLVDGEGTPVSYTSITGGAIYSIDKDGVEQVEVLVSSDFDSAIKSFGFTGIENKTLSGEIVEGEDGYAFSTVDEIEGLGVERYDFIADKSSGMITSAVYTLTNAGDEVLQSATVEFTYGISEDDLMPTAYDAIAVGDEEDVVRSIEIRFDPDTEKEQLRTYAIKEGVQVVISTDDDGVSYDFFKNVGCTMCIDDFAEIIKTYGDVRVYAAPTLDEEISFAFTLTDADVEAYNAYIEKYEALGISGENYDEAEMAREYVEDKMSYFVHQYYMGQIQYYLDITNEAGLEKNNYAQEVYNDAYTLYLDTFKNIYLSESAYAVEFFADWSEEEIAMLFQDNEAIAECEEINTQLEQEYNDLKTSGDQLSADIEVIYEKFVENNQKLAKLNGFDNAYEYYSHSVYNRVYTTEERANFISYIQSCISAYQSKANSRYKKAAAAMSSSDITAYNEVIKGDVTKITNPYISGYINSYEGSSLKEKMSSLYTKKAAKFASSSKSMGTAYANYSPYYEEGFTFFGADYQDLLTVIHEMGHYVSFSSYSLSSMGYDLAETHSQGNEWMMLYYLKDVIKKKVHDTILMNRLANSMTTILLATLVDEFEYRVYTSEEPIKAGEFRTIMEGVLTDFKISKNVMKSYYNGYVQIVTILSPVYYLNYATSELSAIGFYLLCEEEGYAHAQEVYRKLQEECDLSKTFSEILKEIGLPSPFEEDTYTKIGEVFFPA